MCLCGHFEIVEDKIFVEGHCSGIAQIIFCDPVAISFL